MIADNLLSSENPDISVVIPCLNEEDTLGKCLSKLETVAKFKNFTIEVIVADNGSQDHSIDIASEFNVRVVKVSRKGYGAALMGGIEKTKAPFILMADADDSYDFLEIPKFFLKIKEGFDLVQGCRLPRGGGKIIKGAMPWTHRYIGNPLFTFLVRSWFSSPINDVYCGMRAFKKSFYDSLQMRCTGMEFATEMIIKAANSGAKTVEIPITLHKDGRIQHPPHLRTIRDGWKTLQFFLLCAPTKLFLVPGILMILLGTAAGCFGYSGSSFNNITLGCHTMLGGSLFIVSGFQAVLTSFLCTNLSSKIGFNIDRQKDFFYNSIKRNDLKICFFMFFAGLLLWMNIFWSWKALNFGVLDYSTTLKAVIPGATLISLSFEMLIFILFNSWSKIEIT